MTNLENVIEGSASLFLLAALVYGPWQWVCTDFARQFMFSKRDELFDMAMRGEIEFDSPEYVSVRDSINDMIRFSHGLTWIRIAVLFFLVRHLMGDYKSPATTRINMIGKFQTKKKVSELVNSVNRSAVYMVLAKSPVLLLVGVVTILPGVLFVAACLFARDIVVQVADELGATIQSEAALAFAPVRKAGLLTNSSSSP